VEPYGNDQFFNAWRVVKLGIGAAAQPHLLTAEAAARILEKKVLSPAARRRAAALGARILGENGIATAADRCEARLAGSRCAGVEQQANCA
jgi:UDP:flavonoid glycosyltransferase YjiC (YdhE family)